MVGLWCVAIQTKERNDEGDRKKLEMCKEVLALETTSHKMALTQLQIRELVSFSLK